MADTELKRKDVQNLINDKLGTLIPGDLSARIHVLDNRYRPVEADFLLDTIRTCPILARHRYKQEVFDCDDYVFYLKTQVTLLADMQNERLPGAVGCILTEFHAVSFCINGQTEIVIVNTQADEVTTESRSTRFAKYLRSCEQKDDGKDPTIKLVLI